MITLLDQKPAFLIDRLGYAAAPRADRRYAARLRLQKAETEPFDAARRTVFYRAKGKNVKRLIKQGQCFFRKKSPPLYARPDAELFGPPAKKNFVSAPAGNYISDIPALCRRNQINRPEHGFEPLVTDKPGNRSDDKCAFVQSKAITGRVPVTRLEPDMVDCRGKDLYDRSGRCVRGQTRGVGTVCDYARGPFQHPSAQGIPYYFAPAPIIGH
jgi:hypothetical protein